MVHIMRRVAKVHSLLVQPVRRYLYVGNHFIQGSLSEIELSVPAPVAGRKYLPSSDTAGFPKFLLGPRDRNYPLLLKARNGQETTIRHWAERSREVIDRAYTKYKEDRTAAVVLFRGLPITNAKDFAEWVNGLGYECFEYIGGTAPRVPVAQNVDGGSSDPKEYTMDFHNDMSYNVNYPKMFAICSLKTARWGGETAMCDVREVLAKLDASFVEKCERKLIRYWHIRPDENDKEQKVVYLSWQHQFQTKSRDVVEEHLHHKGYNFEWDGTTLLYWNNLSPIITHPLSSERLWFNQMTHHHCSFHQYSPLFEGIELPNKKYPYHTTFGDGDEIERAMIDEVRRVSWESAVGFQWQDGDVLFMDQLIVQHSRLSYEGDRNVGISLFSY